VVCVKATIQQIDHHLRRLPGSPRPSLIIIVWMDRVFSNSPYILLQHVLSHFLELIHRALQAVLQSVAQIIVIRLANFSFVSSSGDRHRRLRLTSSLLTQVDHQRKCELCWEIIANFLAVRIRNQADDAVFTKYIRPPIVLWYAVYFSHMVRPKFLTHI